mmetsp:Transcript_26210/g.48880  ORF Transcript_26210/g.48880 Transcript_26210/m.48880 type:complete len:93 (-) Transcript_26210:145-423(-)
MPWHVDTELFAGVQHWWPVRLLYPPLSALTVATRIVRMVGETEGRHTVEVLPWHLHWAVVLIECMPTPIADKITELAGGRHGMDTWKGQKSS